MKTNTLKPLIFGMAVALIICGQVAAKTLTTDPPKKASTNNKTPENKVDLKSVRIKNVEFGFDRATINPNSYSRLDQTAKLMIENKAAVKLSGHADNKGAYVYNWKLSQARANAVKDYLVSKGADSSRIAATEFGDTKPIASNKTKAGRKKNRRVEVNFAQ